MRFTFLGVRPDLPLGHEHDDRRDEGDEHRREEPPPAETFRARKIQPPTTKLYAESFKGSSHLRRIQEEAQAIIQRVFP